MAKKVSAHSLRHAIKIVREFVNHTIAQGPDEYSAICLYSKKDNHAGLNVGWLNEILRAAEAQQRALQHLKDTEI